MKQVTQEGNMHICYYTMHSTWLGNTIDQTKWDHPESFLMHLPNQR
nr:hypothetical protein Q903MT_gene4733 [Picea sitchensis]